MQLNYQHRNFEHFKEINFKDIAYWVAQACKTIDQRAESYLDKKKNELKIHQHMKQ